MNIVIVSFNEYRDCVSFNEYREARSSITFQGLFLGFLPREAKSALPLAALRCHKGPKQASFLHEPCLLPQLI